MTSVSNPRNPLNTPRRYVPVPVTPEVPCANYCGPLQNFDSHPFGAEFTAPGPPQTAIPETLADRSEFYKAERPKWQGSRLDIAGVEDMKAKKPDIRDEFVLYRDPEAAPVCTARNVFGQPPPPPMADGRKPNPQVLSTPPPRSGLPLRCSSGVEFAPSVKYEKQRKVPACSFQLHRDPTTGTPQDFLPRESGVPQATHLPSARQHGLRRSVAVHNMAPAARDATSALTRPRQQEENSTTWIENLEEYQLGKARERAQKGLDEMAAKWEAVKVQKIEAEKKAHAARRAAAAVRIQELRETARGGASAKKHKQQPVKQLVEIAEQPSVPLAQNPIATHYPSTPTKIENNLEDVPLSSDDDDWEQVKDSMEVWEMV
jgi:hypothetical protein